MDKTQPHLYIYGVESGNVTFILSIHLTLISAILTIDRNIHFKIQKQGYNRIFLGTRMRIKRIHISPFGVEMEFCGKLVISSSLFNPAFAFDNR